MVEVVYGTVRLKVEGEEELRAVMVGLGMDYNEWLLSWISDYIKTRPDGKLVWSGEETTG